MSLFSSSQESFPTPGEEINKNEAEISIETAEAEINMIMQEVAVMGANDSEMGALRDIQTKLRSQSISPKEAIEQAVSIRESKQDYH
jgi:hypothetical protein